MKLTARQAEILAFIKQRLAADGLPPTRSEIVHHFGFRSPNAAQSHLKALAERGAIELRPGKARGIVPLGSDFTAEASATSPGNELPVIGRVAAGTPLMAIENHQGSFHVDRQAFKPRPDYMLEVHGDSMVDAGIRDGDLLLVHRTPEARSGQIVVARLDNEVTVKRLRKTRGGNLFLDPANAAYSPLKVDSSRDFAIEGLGVGVIRRRLS
ncbi:MAG: transcriptional repressor LexA [Wenzhouxiangella sp.]